MTLIHTLSDQTMAVPHRDLFVHGHARRGRHPATFLICADIALALACEEP